MGGDLVVIVRPPLIHLSVRTPSRDTFNRLGPPQLFRGERAQHVTIPLEPKSHGPLVGRYDVHLTYQDGDRPHHHTVAALTPTDVEAAFRPIAVELARHYLRVVQRVTVEELRRDGFLAVLPSEELEVQADEHFSARRSRLRVTAASFRRLAEQFEFYEPEVLDDLTEDFERKAVFMYSEQSKTSIAVAYHADGFGPYHPPGWYAIPADGSFTAIVERAFLPALGPAFYDAMLLIARELQMGIDIDALELARARAAAALAPPP